MSLITHNTAGCFLTRQLKGKTQILLLYKSWPGKLEGWMPPKGHVEEGETLEAAALRETTEETGYINIKIKKFINTVNIEYPWDDGYTHKKSIHWYYAVLINDEKKPKVLNRDEKNSTLKQKWFTLNKALQIMKFDDEKEILSSLAKQLSA